MPPSDISSSDQPTQPTESIAAGIDSPMRVHHRLPALRTRPPTGLLAWHSTVGYMSQHHSADAQLTIRVIPRDRRLSWTASLLWGYHRETVEERSTLAAALEDLWTIVDQNVVVFQHEADQVISPAHYDQAEWLDIPTQEIFQRLLWMTMTAFHSNWHLVILYQPVETTQRRIQMRLLVASDDKPTSDTPHYDIVIGTWGASLIDACRTLYRNAAPHFLAQTTRTHEMYAIKTEDTGENGQADSSLKDSSDSDSDQTKPYIPTY